MAAFAIIHNASEWLVYTRSLEEESQVVPVGTGNWGEGPRQFPCIVASVLINPVERKFGSCYFYLRDAVRLVEACGYDVIQQGVPGTPMPGQAEVEGHTQRDWEKRTSAFLMALYREMESVKVTNPERFEAVLAQCVSEVDQQYEEDKDKARASLPSIPPPREQKAT